MSETNAMAKIPKSKRRMLYGILRFSHHRITDFPSARGAIYQRNGMSDCLNPSLLLIGLSSASSEYRSTQPAEENDRLVAEIAQQKSHPRCSFKVIDTYSEYLETR